MPLEAMRKTPKRVLSALAVLLLAAASARAGGNRAVLIGISQYSDPEMNDLAYADEDVKTFGSILRDFADYKESDTTLLLNEKATKENITSAIVNLVKESKKNPLDHFILMYAGHGLPSTIESSKTNAFLAPHDAYLNQFFPEGAGGLVGNETFINKAWLVKQLSSMNAKNIIIILDSCYSGAKDFGELYADNLGFTTEFTTGGGDKRDIVVVHKKGANPELDRRIAFLASSRENQPSAEYSELRHGALSYTIFHYLDQVRDDTTAGTSQPVTVADMFGGITHLFDTVEVKGAPLSRVHQPVLVPIPDYDDVKDMSFVSMRGVKPAALAQAVASAAPPAPRTGSVFVDTGDDACDVRFDGDQTRRPSNVPVDLPEGRHLVSVYLPGTNYNTTMTVDVKAGESQKLSMPLRGRLTVESYTGRFGVRAPDLDVYLDDRSVGRTSLRLKNLLAGTHILTVVTQGVRKTRQVEIRPDSPLTVRYKIVMQSAPRRQEDGTDSVTF
jgi:hypothetical protein